ncbi:hypothetical protein ACFPM0_26885 [Pseudonocardia sulfidoxydans]|uniref:hypothetical protein n=1 Tax=Pseudonocardia sulfidoxydans TaxID=54011 RepID=UPI00360C55EA
MRFGEVERSRVAPFPAGRFLGISCYEPVKSSAVRLHRFIGSCRNLGSGHTSAPFWTALTSQDSDQSVWSIRMAAGRWTRKGSRQRADLIRHFIVRVDNRGWHPIVRIRPGIRPDRALFGAGLRPDGGRLVGQSCPRQEERRCPGARRRRARASSSATSTSRCSTGRRRRSATSSTTWMPSQTASFPSSAIARCR